MKLLALNDGNVSLEFLPAESRGVMRMLGAFGSVEVSPQASYDLVRVAGERFVRMDDWDEPCLISETASGRAMLEAIAEGREASVAAE